MMTSPMMFCIPARNGAAHAMASNRPSARSTRSRSCFGLIPRGRVLWGLGRRRRAGRRIRRRRGLCLGRLLHCFPDEKRHVRAHDREVRQYDRQTLIGPAAAAVRSPADRLADANADDNRDQSELVPGQREDRPVEDCPSERGGGTGGRRAEHTPETRATSGLFAHRVAAALAYGPSVDLEVGSEQGGVARGTRRLRDGGVEFSTFKLQSVLFGHGAPRRTQAGWQRRARVRSGGRSEL